MKKVCLFIIMFFMIPTIVFATPTATVTTSSSSIENGKSVTINVTLTDTAAWNIKIVGSGAATCSQKQADVTSDGKSTTKKFSLTCKASKEGTINISVTGDITSGSGSTKDISLTKQVTVTKAKSSVNTLSNLKVDGTTVPGFSSSKTSYTIGDKSQSSIVISANATDSKATISGTGTKSLKYGKNTFNISVSAENGSKRTYSIIVNRLDPRNTNNYLKSLTIDTGEIDFNRDITNYLIKVEHSVDTINISATVENSKATITGTGKKTLQDYINEFKIVVTAENETTKTYVVKVVRKDKDGNYGKLSSDNSVKSISIANNDFRFNNDSKTFNVLVDKDVNYLIIDVVPNDINASVNIIGNTNLKPGLNKVKVQIIAENESINEYELNVYKIGEEKEEQQKEKNNDTEKDGKHFIWIAISIIEFVIIAILLALKFVKKNKTK